MADTSKQRRFDTGHRRNCTGTIGCSRRRVYDKQHRPLDIRVLDWPMAFLLPEVVRKDYFPAFCFDALSSQSDTGHVVQRPVTTVQVSYRSLANESSFVLPHCSSRLPCVLIVPAFSRACARRKKDNLKPSAH